MNSKRCADSDYNMDLPKRLLILLYNLRYYHWPAPNDKQSQGYPSGIEHDGDSSSDNSRYFADFFHSLPFETKSHGIDE